MKSVLTPILHGFAQLNLCLLEGTVCELFVKVACVSVPTQFRKKRRSDSALRSLTKGSLANLIDLLDSWPISPPEEVMILHTVCALSSQPVLWILEALGEASKKTWFFFLMPPLSSGS